MMTKTLELDFTLVSARPYKGKTGREAHYVGAILDGQPVTLFSSGVSKNVLALLEAEEGSTTLVPKDGDSIPAVAVIGVRIYKGDASLDVQKIDAK